MTGLTVLNTRSLHLRDDSDDCGSGGGADTFFGLRIASIFIILIGSMFGSLFPVISMRYSKYIRVPNGIFEFAKWFGSGVIIATAFIHLLSPAIDELGSPCLAEGWTEYPYALALCLLSIFGIFILELIAFRWGTAKLASIGIVYDAHGHEAGSHAAHGPASERVASHVDGAMSGKDELGSSPIIEEGRAVSLPRSRHSIDDSSVDAKQTRANLPVLDSPLTQILGVAILEFGVVLHSVLVGLTLAVDPDFKVLFVVLVFHQTFEGLGVGARLAYMQNHLPPAYRNASVYGALLYGITTPVGIAAGLGVRTTYNPNSTTASIVSGVMDSLSAGILIYTGMVELLAHEFLFSREMQTSSNLRLARCVCTMLLGCGLMALLGKWA
ncbi:Zinc/iron permease [Lentinula raphanica]|uniref:Zinc/iron permease n=1 Tax=Lentinula raphanica TaxID=153919 RepID=A0AA38UF53_9AGAR|nr:Zinc/iron permease [Lentinula raphanica]KAJ3821317.1 Zinc/iron permease [Lentinula raphanica]KAJ3835832.1 Zinc/iron permease [Lentinula raphanica]KAJ3967785.1 Zinc/iron permease [Lentinula raphanica]